LSNAGWLSCRLLENEIQQLQKETAAKENEYCQQIEHLKKENSRQQKLIVQVCHDVFLDVGCLGWCKIYLKKSAFLLGLVFVN